MLKNFLGLHLARFTCLSRDFWGGTEVIRVEHFLRVIHRKTDRPQTLSGKSVYIFPTKSVFTSVRDAWHQTSHAEIR